MKLWGTEERREKAKKGTKENRRTKGRSRKREQRKIMLLKKVTLSTTATTVYIKITQCF